MALKLLIVDDEPMICEGLASTIPWASYGVEIAGTAFSGNMALEVIQSTEVDLVLTDVSMDEMDGLALAEFLSAEYPRITTIIISGYDEFEYARQAVRLGVKDYLLKPVDIDELIALVCDVRDSSTSSASKGSIASLSKEQSQAEKLQVTSVDTAHDCNWVIERALHYIKKNYNRDIKAKTVAEEHFITPNYFSLLIKKETGMSFSDYINLLRIDKAAELLLETSNKVFEIAEYVGYKEYKYFVKVFKKYMGVTPTHYRKIDISKLNKKRDKILKI
ncbi:response regulator [Alteribacillus sp. HJP-4]|uniref:response regulator transcription factor n=1 Tax=Alteribacillus sp. HJP-4 TaxID=2775394 RepID=UPI0035CD1C48